MTYWKIGTALLVMVGAALAGARAQPSLDPAVPAATGLDDTRLVYLDIDSVIEERGPQSVGGPVGSHERIRVSYDPGRVDPATGRVPLAGFYHELNGRFTPSMPVAGAFLQTRPPMGVALKAAVVHGIALTVTVSPAPRTITIVRDADGALLERTRYVVDPKPVPPPPQAR